MKQIYPFGSLRGSSIRALCCMVAMFTSQLLLADPCVNDVTPPVANCHSTITVQLGTPGFFLIDASYINNGSTDDCGIATMTLDKTQFTCADLGTVPVVLMVTDHAGNSSTCTTMVMVVDIAPPTAHCKNITVQLDPSGNATIAAGDVNDGSTDCNIQSMSLDKFTFTCADLGANTVTLTVTDNNNMSSTCTAIVTVIETEPPTAVCKDITIYLDATGNATLNPADIDDGSSDNCGIQSMSIDKAQFVCGNLTSPINPPVPVTLTVIDASNNMSTCVANVTVKDTTAPAFTCPADISDTLQASCERDMTLPIPNIVEACGGYSIIPMADNGVVLTVTPAGVVGTFPRGTTEVIYKIDDGFGNWAMCSFTVTLTDVTPPFIPIPVDTFVLPNDPGLCGNIIDVHPCLVPPPVTDNCGVESVTLSHQPGDYFPVGATTITVTAVDSSGLTSVDSVVVVIADVEPPMLGCKDFNVFLNNGQNIQTITAADVISNLSDNCGIDSSSITISVDTLDCSSGSQVVTVSVSDIYGNISTCNATVNVIDNERPNVVCQDITVYLDNNGNVSVTPAMVDNGSTDNCGIASMELDKIAFDCNHLDQNAVRLKVTDLSGNMDSCYAVVNVLDTIAPEAICKNITVQLNANGEATITTADVNNNSTDNCNIANMTVSQTNFDCSHIGANTVTLMVTDDSGNTSTCTATVTVEDPAGGPSVTCQDATIYLDMMGFANIDASDVIAQSSATCGIATTTISQTAFDCMYVGVNQITVTVTDNNGESTNCNANVTVLDTISPMVNCQNINVYLDEDGQANIMAAHLNFGSSDNCGIATKTISESNFNCTSIGDVNVILTVTDNNGNSSSCTGIVTVSDTISPIAKCKNITVQLDANGSTTITSSMIDNGSIDNCAIGGMSVTPSSFDCSHIGDQTVTLTVTDVNGNASTCTSTVTIEDNSVPTITCQDAIIYVDVNGTATLSESDVVASSTGGNCGTPTITLDQTNFTCTDAGTNDVVAKIVAANGQVATCTSSVTVKDTISPTAICRNRTRSLNQNGIATITPAMINNGSSDNCNIASMTLDKTQFTCADVGTNTVTLTVTDDSGNTSTCTATVTIKDTKAPIANCKDISVELGTNGLVSISGADVNNGSTDNCGIQSMTVTPNTFDCGQIGANTVTLTVTDVNGNSASCTSTVTVTDNSSPAVLCKNATIYLDNNGQATLAESDVVMSTNNGNCGTITTTLSKTNFDCTNLGNNTVTVTVTGTNNQTASCTAIVTVKDAKKPVANCRNMTVQLDANGQAVVTTTMINNGSTDNCGITEMTVTPNTFDCSHIGANTVTLTVKDASGNAETCTATVTVKDDEAPVAKCQNVTIYLNDLGKAWTTMQAVDNGSTDNCGITKMTLSKKDFNCSHIGDNTVTLKVEDASGNTSSCTATVTVKDAKKPIAKCKNLVVTLGTDGTASITAAMVDNGSTDNCAIVTRTIDKSQFTCADLGVNTVTLTVKDASGNAKTCTATVTVKSNLSVTPDPVDATCATSSVTCTDGNANSIAYAVRLHGITNGAQDYQSNPSNPLKITTYSDGTAQITGEIRLKANHNYRWKVQVYLKEKMDYPTYQATYNGTAWSNNGDPFQTWDYYIMDHSKTNRFIGKGSFINKTLNLRHNPTNLTKAFQIGIAASIYRTTYSISGWFGFSGSYSGTGDFDFDLDNCTTSGPVSCTDGNPSSAYAVRLHGVTPDKDYKSDPNNPLIFTDLGNGNGTITGNLINKNNSSQGWKVQVYLKEKMDLATYQANYGGSPWANSGDPTTTWDYYLMDDAKANKFVGIGGFAGKVLDLKHKPTNLTTAFQVGTAASIYRTTYSLSGWFSFTGSYIGTGDFDFDLTNCTPVASCDGIAKVTTKGCGPYTYQWSTGSTNAQLDNVCAGSYDVTVTDAGNQTKAVTVVVGGVTDCTPTPPTNGCPPVTCGQGKVEVKEYSTGSHSNALSTITNHSSYPNNPSNTYTLTKLEKTSISASKGIVIKGYIIPPTTGSYDFYFASDDNGKFFLSTDCEPANKRLVGEVTPTCGWTSYKQWNKCPEQKTLGINLLKDKPYYFEIIVKNGGGAGHFAAGWKKPGNTSITSISGNRIALLDCPTNNCPAVTCGQGSIEAYQYTVGSGNGISTITNHSSYPNNPSNAYVLTKLEKSYLGTGKGLVIKGYIIPPTTGSYDFYFASDDNGKFWLSTDCDKANKVLTGKVGSSCGGWTNYKQWTKCTSQRTLNVSLVKDKPYYFEVRVKNGGGAGHFAVGWKKPGSSSITSISGNNLAKYKCATCTSLTNVALNKPTYQSSTGWGGVSSRAVDGNTSGYWSHGSVTHTYYQTNANWELDLQKIHKIDHIKIWNRKDCCASRLKNYYVLVSNKPFTSGNLNTLLNDPNVWHKYMSSQAGYPSTINVGRTGRYVCVMLKYSNYLTLAEVQVMGCMIGDVLARTQQVGPEANVVPLATIENTPTEDVMNPPTDEELDITAYPNPFNNRITVEGFVPEQEEYIDIRILNAQGQEVYREDKIETLGDVKVELSVPNLPNGVYILEATTAQNRKTVKLIRMNNRP